MRGEYYASPSLCFEMGVNKRSVQAIPNFVNIHHYVEAYWVKISGRNMRCALVSELELLRRVEGGLFPSLIDVLVGRLSASLYSVIQQIMHWAIGDKVSYNNAPMLH